MTQGESALLVPTLEAVRSGSALSAKKMFPWRSDHRRVVNTCDAASELAKGEGNELQGEMVSESSGAGVNNQAQRIGSPPGIQ